MFVYRLDFSLLVCRPEGRRVPYDTRVTVTVPSSRLVLVVNLLDHCMPNVVHAERTYDRRLRLSFRLSPGSRPDSWLRNDFP